MSQDAKQDAKTEAEKTVRINTLKDITVELMRLRHQEESVHMAQGRLFVMVYDNRSMLDAAGLTWYGYCEHVGYHPTTVTRRMRCYRNETVRQNYTALGTRKALDVVDMCRGLEKNGVEQDDIQEYCRKACAYGRNNTRKSLVEYTQSVVKDNAPEPPEPTTQEKVKALASEKLALVEERNLLNKRLAEIDKRLEEIDDELGEMDTETNDSTIDIAAMDNASTGNAAVA